MCNNSNCQHNDLDDGLDGLWEDFGREPIAEAREPMPAVPAKPLYEQPCRSCRGTGRFYSYTGRLVGNCFKCKGTGKQAFKTAPEVRERNRQNAADVKARKATESIESFKAAHGDEFAWIIDRAPRFNFAAEMLTALGKYGHLTERQLATVTRLMLQDRERDAQRAAAKAEAEANAVEVDITPIIRSMEKAFANDIKRPLIRLAEFKFAYRDGTIYVRNRSGDVYYGKIVDGRLFTSRDCTAEDKATIVRVAANPEEEAIAYGRREGACAICGRTLTNHESIDRGIGPICANKFGW